MPHSDTRLWHPFADMHAARSAELTIVAGEGVHVTDSEGRRYLDGTASLWNVNVGHGRQELRVKLERRQRARGRDDAQVPQADQRHS